MVSVVIASFNSIRTIKQCIASLINQRCEEEYEIIVVDSSSDGTDEVIKQYPTVKLIRSEARIYAGEARNIGVQNSRFETIAFIDKGRVNSYL